MKGKPQEVLFEETQKNLLLLIVPVMFAVFFGIMTVVQIGFHKPVGNHPVPSVVHMLFTIISVAGAFLLAAQKLKLKITTTEIQYSFGISKSPLIIPVSSVQSISVRKYKALKEFMGWGIRYNATTDCFTMLGDMALEITLTSGKKILIGTQKTTELQSVLQAYFQDKLTQDDVK